MKTKKNLIIFFFLSMSCILQGQTKYDFFKYQYYKQKAVIANYLKDYKSGKEYYEKAFQYGNEYLPNQIDLTEYAFCLLNNNDTAKAAKYIEMAISSGNPYPETTFIRNFGKKYGNKIVEKMPALKKEWYHKQVSNGTIALIELDAADQSVRRALSMYGNNYFSNTVTRDMLRIVDSMNFFKLKLLVEKENIFPSSFIIYHIYGENKKYFAFYDSVLRAGVFTGKIAPEEYVQWYDRQRIYVDKMKTQLYGEYTESDSGETPLIEDIANVDIRRAALGLGPLEDYALLHGKSLPKEYKPFIQKK